MEKKTIGLLLGALIIFGGAGFWGGMTYAQSKATSARAAFAGGAGFGGRVGGAGRAGATGGGAAFGTILSKDATSITVQLMTGTSTTSTGSKIVLYDTSTQIGKMVTGSGSDLTVGQNVTVAGTANSDGSITAQSIQIRPVGGPRGGATQ